MHCTLLSIKKMNTLKETLEISIWVTSNWWKQRNVYEEKKRKMYEELLTKIKDLRWFWSKVCENQI